MRPLLCETFPVALEAWVAVEACVATGVPTWVGFTAGPNGSLMTPEIMRDAARGALERGAMCVLVNCTPAVATLPYVQALATLGRAWGACERRPRGRRHGLAGRRGARRRALRGPGRRVGGGRGECGGQLLRHGPAHTAALARRFSRSE
ncbi:MAG: homocysteine S-methyltransferase family protein [Sandaracinaceae bacterium]|nr:homocysteine S-methyltransferase family protein [Sandaracinaceae bacterium]